MTPSPGRLVLLGHPVAHSLSPAFQNAALRSAGIPLVYEALDVAPAELGRTLRELRHQNAAGNVTIPHKAAVLERCDELTPLARRVGAVNTFFHRDGRLVGDNTDVAGFDAAARALLGRIAPGARVALLGAGGAAAAVLAAVEEWPDARVAVFNRSADRAVALCRRFGDTAAPVTSVDEALRSATVVVNATSVGLHGDEMPVDPGRLPSGTAVLDLVYRRGETPWIRRARALGHPAADGLEMLLAQGAAAFARWFGRAPDLAAMRSAVA